MVIFGIYKVQIFLFLPKHLLISICYKNKRIGGNKHIGGTFFWKLINVLVWINAYRWDFFSFSNKRPVRLFGTLEYMIYGKKYSFFYFSLLAQFFFQIFRLDLNFSRWVEKQTLLVMSKVGDKREWNWFMISDRLFFRSFSDFKG